MLGDSEKIFFDSRKLLTKRFIKTFNFYWCVEYIIF